jgi:Flp pilus assembly protein TadG
MAPTPGPTYPAAADLRQPEPAARLRQLRRNERGSTLVMIGFGLMAMFAATMLAIDVGMLMTARTQAQIAADAGALAGATALVYNNFTDHSSSGPAVVGAINTARTNLVVGRQVSVSPADVTFPFNTVTGQSDQVQVTVYRTAARANPVATMIASVFGIETVDVSATATAVAAPADSATCVLPFTIPDKWIEKGCGTTSCAWSVTETFDMYEIQGQNQNAGPALLNPDIYIPPGNRDATGYNPTTDRGLQLVLKNNNQNKVAPSMYNAWAIPGGTGADYYRENIAGCNSTLVAIGDLLTPETGNMTGPTQQGTSDLMASDPNAHWDEGCNCVRGSAYPVSPRIRAVPLYHPVRYTEGQHSGRSHPELEVVNYLGFFVEDVTGGGDVIGRVHPISGRVRNPTNPAIGAFAQAIMLVK